MSANTYHVFGDLEIPLEQIDTVALEKLKRSAPLLRKLEGADKKKRPLFNYQSAFKSWKIREVATWPEAQRYDRFEDELVGPSGPLDAAIASHLHYPSFTTKQRYNSEIADSTNCCIRLVLEKGFTSKDSFMFNTFQRREKRNGLKRYTEASKDAHYGWSNLLRREMHAKVEVVYGKANRERIEKTSRLTPIELCGSWEGVTIHLELAVANPLTPLRIIVFVHHPEHFYHNWDTETARVQDLKLNAAARLAGVAVDESFYEKRARWYSESYNPLMDEEETREEDVEDDAPPVHASSNDADERPAKRQKLLRKRGTGDLIQFTKGMLALEKAGSIFEFSDLPIKVTTWLDFEHDVGSLEDLQAKYRSIFEDQEEGSTEKAPELGLMGRIHRLVSRKGGMGGIRGRTRDDVGNLISVLDKYVIHRPGETMKRKCGNCGRNIEDDTYVRYWKTHPTYYVAHGFKGCHSKECEGHRQWAIPVDGSIPWEAGQEDALKGAQPVDRKKIAGYKSQVESGETLGLPTTVKVKCNTCGKEGKDDVKAEYDKHEPHYYLAMRRTCAACKKRITFLPADGQQYVTTKILWDRMQE
ncbi:MAG: hypothetical protein M1819_001182 [Sarea resinae]|nr:MAG: hypothetical protein M1819_001182 [Sarea resinae]